MHRGEADPGRPGRMLREPGASRQKVWEPEFPGGRTPIPPWFSRTKGPWTCFARGTSSPGWLPWQFHSGLRSPHRPQRTVRAPATRPSVPTARSAAAARHLPLPCTRRTALTRGTATTTSASMSTGRSAPAAESVDRVASVDPVDPVDPAGQAGVAVSVRVDLPPNRQTQTQARDPSFVRRTP